MSGIIFIKHPELKIVRPESSCHPCCLRRNQFSSRSIDESLSVSKIHVLTTSGCLFKCQVDLDVDEWNIIICVHIVLTDSSIIELISGRKTPRSTGTDLEAEDLKRFYAC